MIQSINHVSITRDTPLLIATVTWPTTEWLVKEIRLQKILET